MTLKSLKTQFTKQLASLYPAQETLSILQILCEDLLGWTKSQFHAENNELLTNTEIETLTSALAQLQTAKPVQYITGIAHFYGHVFKVSEHTLIPRQETEELVHLIIQEHKNTKARILDIGSGSGCIAIALALALPQAQVHAVDVSSGALRVATENASSLNAEVICTEKDILKTTSIEFYDIVVSNPPYVRDLEKTEIHANVLEYEPHTALFVPNDDALIFYRHILWLTKPHNKTIVYFEINQYLGAEMLALATAQGYVALVLKDLNGNDRMMKCWQVLTQTV